MNATERLYYTDSYLTEFSAPIAGVDPDSIRVRLARTAFYPTSGGQPYDTGTICGVPVIEVTESGEDIVHVLDRPLPQAEGSDLQCRIDWQRRFDHMQQHTGQHLLSAVLAEIGGVETVSFHLGSEASTIDLACDLLKQDVLEAAECRCNETIAENRQVTVAFEDAATATGLRKASERTGTLRIVSIEGMDRSACGGTHVRRTGEIGAVLLRGTERIRGNVRLEFVCGRRAIKRARADYNALTAMARATGSAPDEAPKIVAAWAERLAEAEKQRTRLASELARSRGRERYAATEPGPAGLRFARVDVAVIDDDTRAEAQAFTSGSKAVYVAACASTPSVLLACSADSDVHAGDTLKPALSAVSGRGGGSARLAQGSVPSAEALRSVLVAIERIAAPH
jgi:alanyl-tRNA synthetase